MYRKKKDVYYKAAVSYFNLHSQFVLALASVPLCDRKTLAPYIRMYLKQASNHLKSDISFLFAVSDKRSTLYMTNDEFNHVHG